MEILSAVEKEARRRLRLRAHEQVMRRAAEHEAEQISEVRELRTASGFRVVSLTKSMTEPVVPAQWLWQDRLAAGTFNLLVAKPKVGKSTFARHLASSVAGGSDFLCRRVRAGKVVYLALEERREDVEASFLAIDRSCTDNLFVTDAAMVQDVLDLVEQHCPALLVIDPLIRLVRLANEYSYAKVYEVLNPFIDVARSTGATILALNHSPKQSRHDPIDMGIGSIGFSAAVNTQLVMRRVGDKRTLQSVQRVGPDLPETILNLDKSSNRFALGSAREEFDEQQMEQLMIAAIDASPGMTESEIDTSITGRTEKKRSALRTLKKAGKIEADGSGRRNDPYRYRAVHPGVPRKHLQSATLGKK